MKVTDLGVSAEPMEVLDAPPLPSEIGGAMAALLTAVTGSAGPAVQGANRRDAVALTVQCLRANPGAAAALGIGAPVRPPGLTRTEWGARFDVVPHGRPREIGDVHEHPDEWSARTHVAGVNRNEGWVTAVVSRTVRTHRAADGTVTVVTGPWTEVTDG